MAGGYPFAITVTDSYVHAANPHHSFHLPSRTPAPPESGTVTITATSGGIVNTITIAVSVPSP